MHQTCLAFDWLMYCSPGIFPSNIDGLWLGVVHWHHDSQWCTPLGRLPMPHSTPTAELHTMMCTTMTQSLVYWSHGLQHRSLALARLDRSMLLTPVLGLWSRLFTYALPKCLNELGSCCTDVGSRVRQDIKAGVTVACDYLHGVGHSPNSESWMRGKSLVLRVFVWGVLMSKWDHWKMPADTTKWRILAKWLISLCPFVSSPRRVTMIIYRKHSATRSVSLRPSKNCYRWKTSP